MSGSLEVVSCDEGEKSQTTKGVGHGRKKGGLTAKKQMGKVTGFYKLFK